MKKITLKLLLVFAFMSSTLAHAQCLAAVEGLYPGATATAASCDGLTPTIITELAYASEYSNVEVTAGETYSFRSSVATDFITISTDDGLTAATFGVTPLTWVSDVTGVVRFYTHTNDQCGASQNFRTRAFVCGVPPCIQPVVAFAKTYDCLSASYEVTVDITDMGSASSITVTDDQESSSQSVSSANMLTFGPYAFGTAVVITATNDQTPICNIVSDTQIVYACPPENDECAGAFALTVNPDASCTEFLSATITAATASAVDATGCFGTEDDDVWFSFVATSSVQTISLNNVAGSTTDLFHSLWAGTCDALTLVPNSCSDANASIPTGLTVGETYYLRVYSWTDEAEQTSTFDVCIGTPPPPPANDECENAIALNCGDVLTGQTTESANGGTDTSCLGTIGNDVWYSFVGDDQVITLTAIASIDAPQIEVYASTDGNCSGFAPGTCIAAAGTGDATVSASFVSQSGTTYFIHIGTWINGNPAMPFDLSITCEAPATPPANDDCDGAESLTVNTDMACATVTSGTVSGATASAVDADSCGGTEDDDVWYSFVATDTLQAINLNNIAGSDTGLNHSLWAGTCAGLTLVPGSCGGTASVVTGLTAGETYYVRVYTATGTALQNTTFDICIGTPPPPPANDDCTGAIEITAGGEFVTSPVVGSNVSSTTTAGLPTFGCQPNRSNDVWYSVVVPDSGSLTIETAAAPGTVMTDSVISVYAGVCGSLQEVGCNDDDGTDNFSKAVLTGLTPGETIYIGVWKWGTSSDGDFQLSAYDASLLSNDTFDNSNFKSYPNPVKDILHFSYNKNITNVAVFNLLGQEVITKSTNANQSQVDMSNLAKGTYLVKVTADSQVKTIKVVKE